jgi:hypothetical protein
MLSTDPASPRRTMPDRQVMLEGSRVRQDFLLSPQSSALITHYAKPLNAELLNLVTDTGHLLLWKFCGQLPAGG